MKNKIHIDYVSKLQAEYAKSNPNSIGVFVLPVLNAAGEPTDTAVRSTSTPGNAYIEVMSVGDFIYIPEQRSYVQDIRHAFIYGPAGPLERKYKPGDRLHGRIVVLYSCEDKSKVGGWQLLKCADTGIQCFGKNGQQIYFMHAWREEENATDDLHPEIGNIEDIVNARHKDQ